MAANNCRGGVVVVTCPTVCEEPQEISLQNVNLSGIGVLDSWSSPNGDFRGVVAGNAMVTVTLDAVNHTIVITPQAAAIAAALPAATETQVGVLETATNAEAIAKTATDKILVPSNLAALGSSTTFAGLIEIATQPEVVTGTATNLAVVPATLAGMNFFTLNTASMNVPAGATPTVELGVGSFIEFAGSNAERMVFNGPTLSLEGNSVLNFTSGSDIAISGTPISDDSLLGMGTGAVDSFPITAFFSSFNTQSGYTAFPNASVLRTADVNTVTLPQLASIVNTLISDMKLMLAPVN